MAYPSWLGAHNLRSFSNIKDLAQKKEDQSSLSEKEQSVFVWFLFRN